MSDNKVFISEKDIGNYIGAALKQLEENGECSILARGQENNGKAIDVACIVRRDEDDAEVSDIELSTEEFSGDDGDEYRVSGIEIVLSE